MGKVVSMARCWVCRKRFACSPRLVPSFRDHTGKRHPLCRQCVVDINNLRAEGGVAPVKIEPGAYDGEDVS